MTLLVTMCVVLWLALPGLLLAGRTQRHLADVTAIITVSIVAMLLLSAILSMLIPGGIGAWFPLLISFIVSIALLLSGYRALPALYKVEWQIFLPSICVILFSAYTYHIGFAPQPDGSLAVHSWYNADWFKHLGHVHAVSNLGLPAKDIFGGGDTLHYYWLFYLLPGASASVTGDTAAALYWSNILVSALFWMLVYALVRKTGISAWVSGILAGIAPILFGFNGTVSWLKTGLSMTEFIKEFEPAGPVLISMGLYIPQHTLMVSVLMAWALLCYLPAAKPQQPLSFLTLFALAGAGALSTLFGALCLIIYGTLKLLSLKQQGNWRATMIETAIVAAGALAVIFWLSILDPGFGGNAIASPVFVEPPSPDPYLTRFTESFARILSNLGPALLLGVAMVIRWSKAASSPMDNRLQAFAAICILLGLLAAILPEAFMENIRLAREIRLRASFLPAIGAAIALGWMLKEAQEGRLTLPLMAGMLAVCTALALPSAYMRIMWHGLDGPIRHTAIPADDMRVLQHLGTASPPNAIVWQYPEPPELAGGGDDTWVPIIAGRTIAASLRTTDYTNAVDEIAAMTRFYNDESEDISANVSWIYLSRHLHPKSYDMLEQKLIANPAWQKNYCLKDACLFMRASANAAQ